MAGDRSTLGPRAAEGDPRGEIRRVVRLGSVLRACRGAAALRVWLEKLSNFVLVLARPKGIRQEVLDHLKLALLLFSFVRLERVAALERQPVLGTHRIFLKESRRFDAQLLLHKVVAEAAPPFISVPPKVTAIFIWAPLRPNTASVGGAAAVALPTLVLGEALAVPASHGPAAGVLVPIPGQVSLREVIAKGGHVVGWIDISPKNKKKTKKNTKSVRRQ
mmetsp:Transcript_40344/g.86634  ORF Transcript_40344/g.86634 Transcript_40344/m.86634 type:complete len:219 (-) Transcript_40344:90-746(-)